MLSDDSTPRVNGGYWAAWSATGRLVGLGLTRDAAREEADEEDVTVAAVHLIQVGSPAEVYRFRAEKE